MELFVAEEQDLSGSDTQYLLLGDAHCWLGSAHEILLKTEYLQTYLLRCSGLEGENVERRNRNVTEENVQFYHPNKG